MVGIALAFVPLGGAATPPPPPKPPPAPTTHTFKVDSVLDEVDIKPGDGICKSASNHCTLRAALNEVSSLKSDGKPVIITVPEGEFNLQIDPPAAATLDEAGGDLDLVSHDTPPPSVTINGAGSDKTIITQLRGDRVLELAAPEPVTISGVAIRGGSSVSQGGGIANSEPGGLTLQKSEVTGNSAEEGGGIYSRRPLTVSDSRIADNKASSAGGGVAMSTAGGKLTSDAISGNAAGQLGGGVWLQNVAAAQISTTIISGNSVTPTQLTGAPPSGGGIEVDTDPRFGSTTLQVTYSTIRGNSAAGAGGGIFWQATGTLALDSSLIAANTAETGGGIATGSGPSNAAIGTIQLTNTTLSGNVAERGGGMERSEGNTLLRAVTIAGNSAPRGSGIAFAGARAIYSVATGLILANLPVSQNCALTTRPFGAADRLSTPGANLESGAGCHLQSSDLSSTNPLLAPLANNGGPTQTRALLPGSPAVDRYTGADCPAQDQRAYKRPSGAACDIGAFEQSSVRAIDVNSPPRPIQDVIGGTLTLIPSGVNPISLHGRDYRPCTGKRHLNEVVTGGYFDSPEGRLAARGTLVFLRKAGRSVSFGNFLIMLDGTIGHVFATLAPTSGALQLFDVTGVHYGEEKASGRLFLTATAARLLNHRFGGGGFQGGMECGRFSLRARIFHEPKPPPKPPTPPAPPKPTTTTTTPAAPPGSTLTVVVTPDGSGSVHSSRAGIACPTACTFTFAPGETVTLEENSHNDKGYDFDHWDGSCSGSGTTCTVTMDINRTVTARFKGNKQCNNGIDDDKDGKIDYPADPGCSSPLDDSESG